MMCEAGITRIADITDLDRVGLPVALAVRPNAYSLSVSSGKGLDWESAAASAAMEAIEMFHAEQPGLKVLKGTYSQVSEDYMAACVDDLPRRKKSLFHAALPLSWTFAWDITGQQEVVVPLQMIQLREHSAMHVFSRAAGFPTDTNGLASGNHFLEALCAGIYEVIERDAWACHLYAAQTTRHEVPKVNLSLLEHHRVGDVLERLYAADLQVHLYDCKVDTDVPVYRAVLCDPVDLGIPLADGYGAHLDPAVAMLRALTEAAQSRTVAISGSRDDMLDIHHGNVGLAALRRQIQRLDAQPASRDARELESEAGRTFQEDVHVLASRLKMAGIDQVLVVELAAFAESMSVLKVIVPGLEPCLSHGNLPGTRAHRFRVRVQND